MTLIIDFSDSLPGVDMAQIFELENPLNATLADTMNFRTGPFLVRWQEVVSIEGDGNRTFATETFPVGPALEDIYLGDTSASPPSRSSLPLYSFDLGEVFYLIGSFPAAPGIEEFVRSSVYADSQEPFENRDAALADLRSFGDA